MIRIRGLAFKLSCFVLAGCTVVFGLVLRCNYVCARRALVKNIEASARNLLSATVNHIETVLAPIATIPDTIADILETGSHPMEDLTNALPRIISKNADVYGSTIAFEPYAYDTNRQYYAPYFYRRGDKIEFRYLGDDEYRYFFWDWYQIPQELQHSVWSEPYYDKGGGDVIMVTYSAPFYASIGGRRVFRGVVTADISLAWLQRLVSRIKVGETGYGFLISNNGTIVTHPNSRLILNETIFSVAEERGLPELRALGREMVRGHSALVQTDSMVSGKKCWLAYAPLPSTGWSLGIYFPQDEVLADLMRLSQVAGTITAVGFVFLLAVIIAIAGSITRPLRSLAAATHAIGAGRLDAPLPRIRTRDEVGELAGAFVYMRDALRQYIRNLTEATAARERIESELTIANEIQRGIVPRVSAEFAARADVDVCPVLQPARQVGGDLYDFFCVDRDQLCLVIGDVSGKGVPAALLMAETHALVRMAAKTCVAPDRILAQINAELARDNEACMFVTLFCAVMNTRTGVVTWANGGHNPPLLLRPGRGAAFLDGPTGPALGILPGATFGSKRLELQPDDALVMYTDGVTEAFNSRDEAFSDERLQALVAAHQNARSCALVDYVVQAVNAFAGDTPQSDDITLLVVRRRQASAPDVQEKCALVLRNDLEELRRLEDAVNRFGAAQALSAELINDLQLTLEEVVANIIAYGYADGAGGEICVALERNGATLTLTVSDDARAFNPLEAPPPNMSLPHDERPIGGLGIFLVRQLMDAVRYAREEQRNILVMTKHVPPTSA